MLIVSAADARMADVAAIWRDRVSRLGYDYILYDLGGLGHGPRLALDHDIFSPLDESRPGEFPGCLYKPALVRAVCRQNPGELVVYLDVDAFPLARFDEVDDVTYDVGLTLRMNGDSSMPPHFRRMGMVNAGVMFFRSSSRSLEYLDGWHAATLALRSDQKAVNESLGLDTAGFWKRNPRGEWLFDGEEAWSYALYGPDQSNTVFKFWPARVYNWYRAYKPRHEIKILHCRGAGKNLQLLDRFQ